MSRFKKEDWLALGAKLLAEEGPAALTIDRLTAAARRTRGSFYHHFEDRDAFLRAMMERWRTQVIEIAGKRYEAAQSEAEIRALMREQPFELDFRFEREIRRLAASEPIVCEILNQVDCARIEGLACLLTHMRPDIDDPMSFAFVQYCAVVGAQWLLEDPNDPRLPAIRRTGNRLFGLSEPEEPAR
ncbi:helix-turn-helix domain-containing protein [Methylocystis iwaonis]|uniref:TetR/AcrR family transcriptional regulator n=1 Tax=Methylocystis iwaonis TaxID=2885079 RepID=UPI002E7BA83E|nr:helix-turn-helix domain-containing protein [Methylocystis iwaonis]